MTSFKASPIHRKAFHNLMEQGKTPAEIAEAYGVTEFAVVLTLRNPHPKIEGANYKHLRLPISDSDLAEAVGSSAKVEEVAEKYGVTPALILSRLRDLGLSASFAPAPAPAPSSSAPSELAPPSLTKNQEKIKSLYESGLALSEVGVRVGISPASVRHELIKMGVPRRKRGCRGADKSARKVTRESVDITGHLFDMVERGVISASVARELDGLFKKALRSRG